MGTQGSLALMPHHMHDDGAYRYGSRTTKKLLMFGKDSEYLLVKLVMFGDFGWQDRCRPQYEVVSVLVLGPRLATKRAMLKNVVLATSLLQGAATIMWARSS